MTMRCSVRGCKTGSYSDKQQKLRDGVKRTTVFTVPKYTAMLEKWSRALNQGLSRGDKVCELHFADADIKRSDDTLMPDGSIFSLPRQKYTLHKNVVPIDISNQENKAPMNTNGCQSLNIDARDGVSEEEKSSQNESSIIPDIIEKNLTENNPESSSNNCSKDSADLDAEEIANNECHTSSFMQDHQYYFNKNKSNQYYYYNKEVAAAFAIPTLNKEAEKLHAENSENDGSIENNENNSNEETLNLEELPSGSESEISPKLSFPTILYFLQNTPLQKSWSWMKCTKIDNGITFTQINCRTRKIRCYVELHEDLSVLIQTADEKIRMEMEFVILSGENILNILETVEKLKICNGSGVEKQGKMQRSPNCTGIVDLNDQYKISMACDRCIPCRKIRRHLLYREKKPKIDIKDKYEKAKKELELIRRRCKCLEEKLNAKNERLTAITEMIKSVNKYSKIQR